MKILSAPKIFQYCSKFFGKLSFSTQRILCINLRAVHIIREVISDMRGVAEALQDRIHEASVTKIIQSCCSYA